MSKLQIISVGKVRQDFVLEGEQEYLKRMKGVVQLELVELGFSHPASLPVPELMGKEARGFLSRCPAGPLIVLDQAGKAYDSQEFAKWLESLMQQHQNITFGIGGAYGWDSSVKNKASGLLSLSKFTFPHQLTRLILVEQIYRAISIIRGLPYHKQ